MSLLWEGLVGGVLGEWAVGEAMEGDCVCDCVCMCVQEEAGEDCGLS